MLSDMGTTLRITFANDGEMRRWRNRLSDAGLDDVEIVLQKDRKVIPKRNGRELAAWLRGHAGWHVVLESNGRSAAHKAAYKIRSGQRAGFETGGFEARASSRGGVWVVEARFPTRGRHGDDHDSMKPLF